MSVKQFENAADAVGLWAMLLMGVAIGGALLAACF
jgi:hypothetical protein